MFNLFASKYRIKKTVTIVLGVGLGGRNVVNEVTRYQAQVSRHVLSPYLNIGLNSIDRSDAERTIQYDRGVEPLTPQVTYHDYK